ncbi:Sip1-related alpha-galactosidase [Virgibacillus siamensis]|uniref:Sip1-related alpha-galactosidase n=1 Tax=Virgibacillus siamensis TaxID=480071 RepID=UPI000985728F|nr:Sip1-related alpha-galactosidase [Virgibacillus siamensis]
MFKVQNDHALLQLFFGQEKVMHNISLEVQLDQIGKVDLEFTGVELSEEKDASGKYTQYKYNYKNKGIVEFSFILNCYDQFVRAYTDVVVHSERQFGKNNYFPAENGVVINITDLGKVEGLFAAYRHKDWWTRPHFDQDITTLPSRTQSLLWKNKNHYYYLLPVVGSIYKTDIAGDEQGICLTVSSHDGGRDKCQTPVFVLGKGNNPFELAKQTTSRLLELSGNTRTLDERRYPKRLDYLGWCSWDAFYHDVNEKGILNKLEELKAKQLPVKWVMIDDGWSQTADDRLVDFGPDATKFPNGFKKFIRKIKEDYGVKSAGVWHTLAGYWGGVHLNSSLANEMAPYLLKTNSEKLIPYPDKGKGFVFWEAWHSYLFDQGIDFLKVDSQSAINNFTMKQMSIGQASTESHKALEASVGINFDHCVINCMGMASENIWNRPISAVSRSSDDFVPDDENGFAEHALQNVYNSFYQGGIYWCDWDMFWSKHKDSKRHALLRALSGGPIYTSDPVGQTDDSILWPLIYKDGKIIRCEQQGLPTIDMLMSNPVEEKKPLKMWNTSNGIGLLGVFNVSQERVSGDVSPANIEGFNTKEYYVYDYFNRSVKVLHHDERIKTSLEKDHYSLYFVIPKDHVIKPLGLQDKYVSPATFTTQYVTSDKVVINLKEEGTFVFLAESGVKQVKMNGEEVSVKQLDASEPVYTVECFSTDNQTMVLEIQE